MPPLSTEQIERLAEKMLLGTITPDEQILLDEWARQPSGDKLYWASADTDEAALKNRLLARIRETAGLDEAHEERYTPVRRIPLLRRIRTAAAVIALLLLTGGGYWFLRHRTGMPPPVVAGTIHVSVGEPGGERAVLTLADGTDIVLDSAGKGQLAQQGGVKVIKTTEGQLKYVEQPGSSASLREVGYNTMRTPRGGQYQLILPDGTKAWLNAASSITYPAAFGAGERIVKITGEVYLEVAPDKNKPFLAEVNDMRIEVLGTHFNINAYSDESSRKTTLLEGNVRVSHGTASQVLLPGQQAVVNDRLQINKNIDTGQVMAWKNGLFIFDNKKLDEIMRQLSRWYDIDIEYEQGIPNIELAGEMGRDLNLLQVLAGLKDMNVHFRLEGRKLIILR